MALRFSTSTAVLAVLLAFAVGPHVVRATRQYDNAFDERLLYECPQGEVLHSVYSIHSDHFRDRKFSLDCKAAPSGSSPTHCSWTEDYVNEFDEPINFMCPPKHALAGIDSYHSNVYEDRRMKFKCCAQPGYTTSTCSLSEYLNEWGGELRYIVKDDMVMVGWFSVYDGPEEDRRHKILRCAYGPENSAP